MLVVFTVSQIDLFNSKYYFLIVSSIFFNGGYSIVVSTLGCGPGNGGSILPSRPTNIYLVAGIKDKIIFAGGLRNGI